jgi:hypothetical protein
VNGFHRLLQLLTMTVWVGGLIFFAFILAPTAFHTLPTQHEAGLVVGGSLHTFDYVAMGAGAIFLIATTLLFRAAPKRIQGRYEIEFLLVLMMVLGTGYIHYNILPSMEADRARVNGDINSVPVTHPAHAHFDKLHTRSEHVEGGVLLVGLAVLVLMSREQVTLESTQNG